MVTTATAPERKVSAAEAREVAEAAREQEWVAPSFVRDLFLGKFRLNLIHPYPEQDPEEVRRAQPFLDKLERLLREQVDSDRIDREGEIPETVIQGLRDLGAFGIKIPREYGGLGLSQLSYMKAIEMVSSIDGSVTALLSAHQSIGVPQPLKLFGTDAQKKKYLPRLAQGAISAFALTEPGVGSDPAALETTAVPTPDGQAWLLNGEKLWCTNSTKAELLVVIARTPSKVVNGKEKRQITAFIVETAWPDVETIHSRLPSTRATGLTRLIPTAELTLEPSAEWWTSPMPFSMTIRWPTQLDSALAGAAAPCPTMSGGESSAEIASRQPGNRRRLI